MRLRLPAWFAAIIVMLQYLNLPEIAADWAIDATQHWFLQHLHRGHLHWCPVKALTLQSCPPDLCHELRHRAQTLEMPRHRVWPLEAQSSLDRSLALFRRRRRRPHRVRLRESISIIVSGLVQLFIAVERARSRAVRTAS